MKRHLITFVMLFITAMMFAVPAKRGQWRTITLTDGSKVKVELMGDEFVKFYQAEDGRIFRKALNSQLYHQVTREEIGRIAQQQRAMTNDIVMQSGPRPVNIGGDHQPYEGTKKCLCILVEFTDMQFEEEHTIDMFKELVNGVDFTNPDLGMVGSVRDYFRGQSYGTFDIDFDVVGPFQLAHDYAYYGKHTEWGNDAHAGEMIREAINLAAPEVNFSDYDWDGDGYAEPIFVLYSGKGEADGGDENTIWPHKSSIQRVKKNGVWIRDYACGSELNGRGRIDGIGTMCHEYSHCLGLADMYDTAYGSMDTPGSWDIMDSGCYNGNGGDIPAGYTAFERWYAGWVEPTVLSEECSVSGMQSITSGGDTYVIFNDSHPDEYYMLENRRREGWDAALPGEGLLITHVDFDRDIWAYNMVNTYYSGFNTNSRFTVVHAGSGNERTDAFPYNNNNQFTDFSRPASTLFNENVDGRLYLGKPITDIAKDEEGTISFNFKAENPTPEIPEGAIFYESFMYCNGVGGNDGIFDNRSNSPFNSDNEGWTGSNVYGGSQCASLGTNRQRGNIVSPEINIQEGQSYVLSFKAAPFYTDGTSLTIAITSGDGELSETSFEMSTGQWTEYNATLTGSGAQNIQFRGKLRFFLDEVLVMPSDPTGIQEVKPTAVSGKIYNLAGQQVTAGTKGITISGGRKYVVK